MDQILQLENHWLACMATLGGGGRLTRLPGAVVVANPWVPGTALNFIALRSAAPAALGAVVEMGGALLAGYERPTAVFLSPAGGDMAILAEVLRGLGWQCVEHQSVIVADHLTEFTADVPPAVRVEEIGAELLDTWGSVLTAGYEVSPSQAPDIRKAWSSLLRNPGEGARARYYLAWLEGVSEPVGTGLSWSQGGILGLYCGAVLPAYRRRGVETATLGRRMADAPTAGSRMAVLQTSEGSPVERLCIDRLGFRLAYRREVWLPSRAGR